MSDLILSPVTEFQPYRLSFHPVNVFLLQAFAVSIAFGSSKWPLILLLLLSLNALCDDSLSFILLHVHHFFHRTHHDLDFSSIFITFIYVCLWGAGCEWVHPGILWCMYRGPKTAVRISFLFLLCGTRDRTQVVRLEQQVPLVAEAFFPQLCLLIF